MAIVYKHSKPSGDIFYIGIGVSKKRAYSLYGRNNYWHNTVNKYGYDVEILFDKIDYEEAKQIESYLIKYYGRKDLGLGSLVNMTDGGEGFLNMNLQERQLRRDRMIDYNSNEKNYSFTQSKEYKLKMSESTKNKGCKKIINEENGEIYNSLRIASETINMNYTRLSSMLNNRIENKTNLKWI